MGGDSYKDHLFPTRPCQDSFASRHAANQHPRAEERHSLVVQVRWHPAPNHCHGQILV
jgi:hypothetical protein